MVDQYESLIEVNEVMEVIMPHSPVNFLASLTSPTPASKPLQRTYRSFLLPILLAWSLLLPFAGWTQIDSTQQSLPDLTEALEDFLQNTGDDDFDFNTLFEQLEIYLEDPLNLNTADETLLKEFQLLNDRQIIELLQYRETYGDLIAIYELQAIPGFDLPTIRRILPFVTVGADLDDYQLSLGRMLRDGKNELFIRWSRILEEQKGYRPLADGETGERYLGAPFQLYTRFKHSYSNRLSFGFTAEKDRGEEFFTGSNPNGFDYYSAHFYLRNYSKRIKAVALGDYNVSFGQGLILYSGFGYGKSASAMTVKRGGRTIRPYTSVNEALFMRGAAATIGLGDHWEITGLISNRRRDANLINPDTLANTDFLLRFSSFNDLGYHRRPGEIADENAIGQFTLGGQIKYNWTLGHIALNGLWDRFDAPLVRRPQPYNQFYFNGEELSNLSIDYSYIYQNFNFFGETARSSNGRIATVNGLLIGLDRKVDLAILYRNLPKDYQALNANPFAESVGGRNEKGLYLGLELRPIKNWTLSAYYDSWKNPWLTFTADAPGRGREYRARLTYYLKRRLRVYLEVRDEVKPRNAPENETPFDFTTDRRLFQTRLHISNQLSKSLELRNRIDWGFFDDQVDRREYGFLILQDVIFRPMRFPLSFTARYAIYDTDGYSIRFYHYENDLLYTFSIPPYYNKGTRFYLNLRYRPTPKLTLEARYAQTYWANRTEIGSGLEQIDGPRRSEVRAQVKFRF